MNDKQTAITTLLFVIIIILIISYMYQSENINIDLSNNNSIESFDNYKDVETKTKNWCKKMLAVKLLTTDQYNSCVSTFYDAKNGVMPKEFKTPNTGMSRNYSLYNTNKTNFSANVSGGNTNTIMLVNSDGFYMCCDKNDTVYFVKDVNDAQVNQQEIYFTLIPQTNNIYMVMSFYGKYLIINNGPTVGDTSIPTGMSSRQDWCSTFTGKSMGPMTNWKLTVLENDANTNGNKATFESVQLSNFFLSSTTNVQDKSLVVNYGNDDKNIWLIIPKPETVYDKKSSDNISTQYIVAKESIFSNLAQVKAQIICHQALKDSLYRLQTIVRINYNNIKDHINMLLGNNYDNSNTTITIPNIISNTELENDTLSNNIISSISDFKDSNGKLKNNIEPFANYWTDLMDKTKATLKKQQEQERQQQQQRQQNQFNFGNQNEDQDQDQQYGNQQYGFGKPQKGFTKKDLEDAENSAVERAIKAKREEDSAAAAKAASEAAEKSRLAKILANTVINNIIIMKNNYLQQINADINNVNSKLADLKKEEEDIAKDYHKFLNTISNKLSETKNKIKKNNAIIDRQKNDYDKLNIDYNTIDKKNENIEKIDEISKINTDIIKKTNDNNSILVIIYPLLIFCLIAFLLYLIYITFNKFMLTIYVHYSK